MRRNFPRAKWEEANFASDYTEEQAYFECWVMHCCEAISAPLESLHTKNKQKFRDSVQFGYFPLQGIGRYPKDVLPCIEEYSARSLTYDSDALNGMLGILEAFQRAPAPSLTLNHHWGVPILPVSSGPSIAGFFLGLSWYSLKPTYRRADFPSYSWAGWASKVKYVEHSPYIYYFTKYATSSELRIWVELSNGSSIEWGDIQRMLQPVELANLSHVLRIKGKMIRFRIRHLEASTSRKAGFYVELPFQKRSLYSSPNNFTSLPCASDTGGENPYIVARFILCPMMSSYVNRKFQMCAKISSRASCAVLASS